MYIFPSKYQGVGRGGTKGAVAPVGYYYSLLIFVHHQFEHAHKFVCDSNMIY